MTRNNFEDYSKQFNLFKDWVAPYTQLKKGGRLVLYGAGDVGQAYYYQLQVTGYCEIVLWIDSKAEAYRRLGFDVQDIPAIDSCDYDNVLIAVYDKCAAMEINSVLVAKGIGQEKIIWLNNPRKTINTNLEDSFYMSAVREEINNVVRHKSVGENSANWYKYNYEILSIIEKSSKILVPRLVLQLTQRCTLSCVGCNNLMPKFPCPVDFDFSDIKRNIDLIADKTDRILVLELIGGEPFIYPKLRDVLVYLSKIKNIDMVEITTNGTVIPSDEIMDAIKNIDGCIRISKYKKSVNLEGLIEKCNKYKVKNVVMDDLIWLDSSDVQKRDLTRQELQQSYYKCFANRICKTLYDGKLFCCARAASLYELEISQDENDYLDLVNCNKNDFHDFYLKNYATACDYCTCTDEWREIKAGEQNYIK